MAKCFVIGPIGDKLATHGSPERTTYEEALQVFDSVIAPACAENDLEPIRADQIALSGEITEQVFRHLYEDEVVIADVSGGNPNVMYELGLRHTRPLLTVQLGEYGLLPFDIKTIRSIMFSRSESGLIEARKQLTLALRVGLAEGADHVTATRVWNRTSDSRSVQLVDFEDSASGIDAVVEDLDSDGYLDRMKTIEEGFPELNDTVEKIGEVFSRMGGGSEELNREVDQLNNTGATAAQRLTTMAKFAKLLSGYADELGPLVDAYVAKMDEIDGGVSGILRFVAEDPTVINEDVDSFLSTIEGLALSGREAMEGISSLGSIAMNLGKISKVLRPPSRRIADSIQRMAEATRLMDEWDAAVARIRRGIASTA